VFATNSGSDQINGFVFAEGDRLDLQGQTFATGTSGRAEAAGQAAWARAYCGASRMLAANEREFVGGDFAHHDRTTCMLVGSGASGGAEG
jgi:hypothetical protein